MDLSKSLHDDIQPRVLVTVCLWDTTLGDQTHVPSSPTAAPLTTRGSWSDTRPLRRRVYPCPHGGRGTPNRDHRRPLLRPLRSDGPVGVEGVEGFLYHRGPRPGTPYGRTSTFVIGVDLRVEDT